MAARVDGVTVQLSGHPEGRRKPSGADFWRTARAHESGARLDPRSGTVAFWKRAAGYDADRMRRVATRRRPEWKQPVQGGGLEERRVHVGSVRSA